MGINPLLCVRYICMYRKNTVYMVHYYLWFQASTGGLRMLSLHSFLVWQIREDYCSLLVTILFNVTYKDQHDKTSTLFFTNFPLAPCSSTELALFQFLNILCSIPLLPQELCINHCLAVFFLPLHMH
jgi:hypothetical protein